MKTILLITITTALSFPAISADPQNLHIPDLDPITINRPADHPPIPIVRDGRPVAVVQLSVSGGVINKLFAELHDAIKATTGAELPKANGDPAADQPAIVIGGLALAEQAGIDAAALAIEGFAVKTTPNRIYIIGKDSNGIAWGIADFLERIVGVRWYWPLAHHGRSIRKTDTLVVNPMHYTDAPAYRMRIGWPPFYNGTPYGTLRVNDLYDRLRGGNSWPTRLRVHQPSRWESIYAKDRPEIFALREDGSRNLAMYCYGNPLTRQTFLENIALFRTLDEQERRQPENKNKISFIDGNAISVSPPDLGVYCTCKDCTPLLDMDKGQFETASRLMGAFVKKLAEEVAARWPDMTLIYLPYVNYTFAPEGIEFPDNVEVFIDVTGNKEGKYYQWLITPAGTILDVRDDNATWDSKQAEIGVAIGDDYWSIELYVPIAMFENAVKPATGVAWAGQFTRHRVSDGRISRDDDSTTEYSRMNNKLGGFSRNAADFGLIKFVE